MAEGLLSGVLGDGEEERPEVEAPDAAAGAEAFAAAIAAIASRQDPEVARDTSAFLKKQTQLLEIQADHLEDEHSLHLAHLRNQLSEENVRRFGLRLRVTIQLFAALISVSIGVGLVVIVRDAVTSHQVVIEPFEISPNLTAQVPSGRIVAAGLLDVLARIQAASRSTIEHRKLSNAWTTEIAVEIPEAGLSVGQLERLLKSRFGSDQRIEGDLVKGSSGVALTVRGSGILAKTFLGKQDEIEKLLTQAGEYLFSQSQPGLWMAYLNSTGRDDEAIQFAKDSINAIDSNEKPYVFNGWGNSLATKGGDGVWNAALQMYREAVRLKPDYWTAHSNTVAALQAIGDEEGAVHAAEQMLRMAGGRKGIAPVSLLQNYDIAIWNVQETLTDAFADMEATNGLGSSSFGSSSFYIAAFEVTAHDVEAASLRMAITQLNETNISDLALALTVQATLAEETGDLIAASKAWDRFMVAYANPTVSTNSVNEPCSAAVTYEKTGQHLKADAALDAVGKLTFVDCYRFRGDVLDLRGNWNGAQEWYSKSVKLAPSIPVGYYSWGMALFKHGDLEGAAAKFKDANQKGPHWADPLKAWGDVLVKQGKSKEALAKYDEALKYAPNWKQLKEAREAIAMAKG